MNSLVQRSSLAFLCMVSACGSPPPAAEPTAAPAAAQSAAPASASSAPPSAAETKTAPPEAAPAKPAEAPAAEAPAMTKTVGERLLAPTIAYMLNYSASGAREKVAAACDAASGDDPAKKAACMEKERSKLVSDVLVFDKTSKGTFWTIYQRKGSALAETWRGPIEFADDAPEHVTVKVLKTEKEKGFRQLFAGKKVLTVSSASDSSIELDDPAFGKLVYEARIGLVEHSND